MEYTVPSGYASATQRLCLCHKVRARMRPQKFQQFGDAHGMMINVAGASLDLASVALLAPASPVPDFKSQFAAVQLKNLFNDEKIDNWPYT
jgi:hypothetical protein